MYSFKDLIDIPSSQTKPGRHTTKVIIKCRLMTVSKMTAMAADIRRSPSKVIDERKNTPLIFREAVREEVTT